MLRAVLVMLLLAAGGDAQGPASAPPDRAEQLRKQIEQKRKELAALEGALADEEQKKLDEEAAAEAKRQREKPAMTQGITQADQRSKPSATPARNSVVHDFAFNVVSDQRAFWTSPLRIRLDNAPSLFGFFAVTAAAIGSDTSIERQLPQSPSLIRRSRSLSNYGAVAMAGSAGALYLWGTTTSSNHARETGFLAAEALTGSFLDAQAIKLVAGRGRPLEGNGRGGFWQGGSSFPSEHAAAAWSVASVLAHEYPGPLTQLLAYGAATGISAARVVGRQHFASDALVGSALGWYAGRQVYRAHHSAELDGAEWGRFERTHEAPKPENMGSPSVPLDSWIYPALDRLAALGYVQTAFAGLRPWTRMECARLLQEAQDRLGDDASPQNEGARLYAALAGEFSPELSFWSGSRNNGARIESVYTRFTGISGRPLTDGYHFGQTLTNDFGRPYSEGANLVSGISASAQAGPFAIYVRGEYQYAPGIPGYSENVREAIAASDANPVQPAMLPTGTSRLALLDTTFNFAFRGYQISAGKQSLWWGPGEGGPLLLSDNAEPFYMVRLSREFPARLPSLFSYLGPMRTEFFFGRLAGHHFPSDPFIYGQKVSFKPTPNLEVGFSRTGIFAGPPQPLTWGTFWNSFSSNSSGSPDPRFKPGDRRGGFDFSYRIPGLRNWLTLYSDSLTDDDPSPLAAPRRAAMNPGIYMPRIPGLPKLDVRVEAVYTDAPTSRSNNGQFVYWDFIYHDSHTNKGNLLGSWIGREGRGLQAWSTYWLSPRSSIQVGYRNETVAKDFLEGGTLQDYATRADLLLRPDLSLTALLQFEHWTFPLLSPGPNNNFTASLQLTFWPVSQKKR